jgi:hypothetical protein
VAASVAVTGTAVTGGVLESEIVAGGATIILTLTDDTWLVPVGTDNPATTALIAGITSDNSEQFGWNNVVKANMVFGDVTRGSATEVTILLGAESTYNIVADETVTVTVPAAALAGIVPLVGSPTIPITAAIIAGAHVIGHAYAGPGQILRTG